MGSPRGCAKKLDNYGGIDPCQTTLNNSNPNFFVAGRSLPPEPDVKAVQQEWFGELKKKGWTGERAVEGLRKSVVEDKEGRKFIDTGKMPREA